MQQFPVHFIGDQGEQRKLVHEVYGFMQQRVGVAARNPLSWDGLQEPHVKGFKSSCMNA